jgi:hypothetical protein
VNYSETKLSEIKRSPQDPLSRSPYAQAQTKRYTVIVGSERQRTNRVPASKIHSSVLQLSSYDIAVSIIEKAIKSVKADTVSQYESIRIENLRQATHKNRTN